MKMFSLLPTCLAATLFLSLPVARAADATDLDADSSANDGARAKRQAELLKRYDKNGDGKLDENEKAAAKMEMQKAREEIGPRIRQRVMERFDADHDGKLNDAEMKAAIADLLTRPMVVKRFDANGDGKLDDAEKAQAEQALRARLGHPKK